MWPHWYCENAHPESKHLCGDVRSGVVPSPTGAKDSKLARQWDGPDSDLRTPTAGSGHSAPVLSCCLLAGGHTASLPLLLPN